jgi:26S proteasome regulatory subunit N1
LSKLSHDHDMEVSQNALLGLGRVGAGTNNSRIAQMLRQLAVYYQKEPNHLFLVRIAQGLLHLGKGLLTLSPVHCDNLLVSKVSMAALLTVLFSALDSANSKASSRFSLALHRARSNLGLATPLPLLPGARDSAANADHAR